MKRILMASFLFLFLASVVFAVPSSINYQGVLKNSSGSLLAGRYNMVFSIYSDTSTSTSLWTETQNSVSVEAGLYSVELGSVTPIPASAFNGTTVYLGIKVGTDSEMTPRVPLISVPYAFRAGTAESSVSTTTINGLSAADIVRFGTTEAQKTTSNYGLYVSSEASAGTGVKGVGNSYGVYGETDSDSGYAGYFKGGMGIRIPIKQDAGEPTTTPIAGTMIYNTADEKLYFYQSAGTGGWHQVRLVDASTGVGIIGTGESYGGSFDATGNNGIGVKGSSGNSGYGVSGTNSGNGVGVYGSCTSTLGDGVFGDAYDTSARSGVYANHANKDNGKALYVDDLMYLKPRASEPTAGTVGMIFMKTNGHLYVCTDATLQTWKQLDN